MKNRMSLLFGIVFLLLLIPSVLAVPDTLAWRGQLYNSSGAWQNDTYNFTFTVYDDPTAGSSCFIGSQMITTDIVGAWEYNPSGVSLACSNQSKSYYLNINVNGTDQLPRRRLVLFEYLREFTSNVSFSDVLNNVIVHGNLTADNLLGNLSYTYIQNAPWLTTETLWNANYTTTAKIGNCPAGQYVVNTTTSGVQCATVTTTEVDPYWTDNFTKYNSSWSSTYNATYNSWAYNQTIAAINAIVLFSFWNSTYYGGIGNFSAENSTLARTGNCPAGQVVQNTTTGGVQCVSVSATETDPYWTANYSAYNSSWSSTYNATYDAYNSTGLIKDWNASGLIINWSSYLVGGEPNWNANYSTFLTHINWAQVMNGTLPTLSQILGYNYWNSTYYGGIGNYSAENSTIARIGNCPAGQFAVNTTTSGVQCATVTTTEVDPYWTDNFTKYNASWTSTYNSTYNTWAYNQTTPAINQILAYGYYNSTSNIGNWTLDKPNYANWSNITTSFNNNTIARTGNCPAGQVVMNTTTSGVQCVTPPVATHDIASHAWANDWMIIYSNTAGLVELPFGSSSGRFLRSNGEGALTWEYPVETLWNANYSTFLTHITWANIINGTMASWAQAMNGTLAKYTDLATGNLHTHNAANITAGTFGTGNYTFNGNVNMSSNNVTLMTNGYTCYGPNCNAYITYNSSGVLIIKVT